MPAAVASIGKLRDAVARRRMPAAVADHSGGKGWYRGMVMSPDDEIATHIAFMAREPAAAVVAARSS